jgi:hypothetical protein
MSSNQNDDDVNKITEELDTLLNIRSHLEYEILAINEQLNFKTAHDDSLSPFIKHFFTEFKERFTDEEAKYRLQTLNRMLEEVIQQIKGVCIHQYEEDDIDITSGCCDNTMKITYCTICYSTF